MTKPLIPADLMKSLLATDKAASATTTAKPKAGPGPKPVVKASTKPQGKTGVTHTRMSNRGK
jgi:hypothetical protein